MKKQLFEFHKDFWNAPLDSLLNRAITAAGLGYSISWLEIKAVSGGGPPFLKLGRRCLYRKSDTLKWLEENSQFVHSTSEYK